MAKLNPSSARPALGAFIVIAVVVAGGAAAFAYTAGWLSPGRLTPGRMLAALAPPGGPAPGHRRNHAKGICFTGVFESNGNGAALSRAAVFAAGRYPALGRFNLGTPEPDAADATMRVRGMGLRIAPADGQGNGGANGWASGWEWRTAMINAPVFPVSTPQAFHGLLLALGSKDPAAIKTFAAANPEFATFGAWANGGPWTGSYAEERYNSLDSFVVTDASGAEHAVRWSLLPAAPVVPVAHDELEKRAPDFLEQEIRQRVGSAPQRWTLVVTIANPGDQTSDPSKAWPADRRTVDAGTLVVRQIEAEADGPCREINFDPTVLPPGMRTSDDPFPAARASVYRESYDLRTAEAGDYPRTATGASTGAKP